MILYWITITISHLDISRAILIRFIRNDHFKQYVCERHMRELYCHNESYIGMWESYIVIYESYIVIYENYIVIMRVLECSTSSAHVTFVVPF